MSARARIEAISPQMVRDMDLCKATFGGKLLWAKAGEWEAGNLGIYAKPGCVWTHYEKPKVRK